ncbi:magnesium transporter [Vibrio parahaemolyticus]|uniref:magnesium transporter n=1 Tax=Vibrio mediterranei TaxID=689 RepID=UPI00406904B7
MKDRIKHIFAFLTKAILVLASFFSLSYFFSLLSRVHGKELPEDYFSDGVPTILGLLNSELFMGIIFVITVAIVVYVLYLLWCLHEVAVHRSQYMKSAHANLVFALSLCGLFIDKLWWVLALIIAFTDWQAIGRALSKVIHSGITGKNEEQTQ